MSDQEKCIGRMRKEKDRAADGLGGCLRCGLGPCRDPEMAAELGRMLAKYTKKRA